ncbi:MAG: phytase, partial [Pseudomonadota bacterium]|nr:phytase [Pseudomonadota bacterium]
MPNRLWMAIVLAAVGCSTATDEAQGEMATAAIAAAAETEPSIQDGAEAVAIWLHPGDTAQSLILGAGGTGGLESYDLDGKRFQVVADIEPGPITIRYGFEFNGQSLPLVMVHEPRSGTVVGYSIGDDRRLYRLPGAPLEARDEVIGLCSYRSAITGRVYLYGTTDAGLMLQWELYSARGELQGRLVRTVPLGRGAESCVVDDASGTLYFSDETLGVLAIAADAEAEAARHTIDLRKPYGKIEEEAKGLALVSYPDGSGRLIVADASAGRFAVYSLEGELLGRFTIGPGDGVDAVAEPERIALAALPVGAGYPGGLLVVGDEGNEGAFANFKLVDWRQVATALALPDQAA